MTKPPTTVRVCGAELADGRLTIVKSVSPGMIQASIYGDVCPVHDEGWPYPDGRPVGQCLVTYTREGR